MKSALMSVLLGLILLLPVFGLTVLMVYTPLIGGALLTLLAAFIIGEGIRRT